VAQIVAIHGVNQYDPTRSPAAAATRLGDVWTTAINHSLPRPLDREALVLTYYADLLQARESLEQGAVDHIDSLGPSVERAVLAWGELLGVSAAEAQGRVLTPARWVADTVAKRFGLDHRLVRSFVARFFPELIAYLHSQARTLAQQRLIDVIEREEPQVLIAHSLGSVVAYDTLWQNPGLKIDAMITIGSPLAMPDVVFPHLQHGRDRRKGTRPASADEWINIADPGDIVAIPQPLTDRFDQVTTNLRTGIGAFSMHKATSYLKSRTTAKALLPLLVWDR
jgi:hypothetical protein